MPRVVAVSVGTPKPMQVYGHARPSSMVREPSPTPIYFNHSGPVGHQTAIHSAPVSAFVAENYDYWATHFGVERRLWGDCHFGENLMIAGVHEDSVRVGDLFHFDRGTVLEVTGFRSICSKFVYRMGQPESMLRHINQIGWVGFYLRVVKTGYIGADDHIRVVSPHPENMSVGEMVRLYQNRDADLWKLKRAISNTGLGPQTYEILQKKITHQEDVMRARTSRWVGWRPFEVVSCNREADDVRSIVAAPADKGAIAPYRAGQFVTVRLRTSRGLVARNWSLSDYQPEGQDYRLTVKCLKNGAGSEAIHRLEVGDQFELRPPTGQFVLDRSLSRRVVLISAGIGITPLLSMLKAHAARGTDAPPLVWVHATKSSATAVFRQEVDTVLAANPTFRRQLHFTAPEPNDRQGSDYDVGGRLSETHIEALIAEDYRCVLTGRAVTLPGRTSLFYICGPAAFEKMAHDSLIAAGVDPLTINSESFHPSRENSVGRSVEQAAVLFSRSGAEATWVAEHDLSLLELAEAAGLSPDYGCRMGMCGSCCAALTSGEVVYAPQPQISPPDGQVLLCCARPRTAQLAIEL
jgi:ferredoxin-NADP reductase/MOSC domain-containing protein YiiM